MPVRSTQFAKHAAHKRTLLVAKGWMLWFSFIIITSRPDAIEVGLFLGNYCSLCIFLWRNFHSVESDAMKNLFKSACIGFINEPPCHFTRMAFVAWHQLTDSVPKGTKRISSSHTTRLMSTDIVFRRKCSFRRPIGTLIRTNKRTRKK